MEPGQVGIVTGTKLLAADAALLRAMGLRPNARIRLCQAGGPWIVEVRRSGGASSRIGLAHSIAQGVFVGPAF
jgi:Fe2+ transport system protein FeoA